MISSTMPPTSTLNVFYSCDDAGGSPVLSPSPNEIFPQKYYWSVLSCKDIPGKYSESLPLGELTFSTQVHTHKSSHFGFPLGVSYLT